MKVTPLLEVKEMSVCFHTLSGDVQAVERVGFIAGRGETTCIVGESGCGKSVTSLAIMGLLATGTGEVNHGEILLEGENLLHKTAEELRRMRGQKLSMIFQEPMTSLNPVYTIGWQLTEVYFNHRKIEKQEAQARSIEMLQKVGIPNPELCMRKYPHELSGGMRQRVMIAMALALDPKLLIADEPTTALDVTIQAQILELMKKLKEERDTGIILITHDMGVVAEMADRVIVMYAGQIVEEAEVTELFAHPLHPYTQGLIGAIPPMFSDAERLETIKGSVPTPGNMPAGCRFAPRCPRRTEACDAAMPGMDEHAQGHRVRCIHAGERSAQA